MQLRKQKERKWTWGGSPIILFEAVSCDPVQKKISSAAIRLVSRGVSPLRPPNLTAVIPCEIRLHFFASRGRNYWCWIPDASLKPTRRRWQEGSPRRCWNPCGDLESLRRPCLAWRMLYITPDSWSELLMDLKFDRCVWFPVERSINRIDMVGCLGKQLRMVGEQLTVYLFTSTRAASFLTLIVLGEAFDFEPKRPFSRWRIFLRIAPAARKRLALLRTWTWVSVEVHELHHDSSFIISSLLPKIKLNFLHDTHKALEEYRSSHFIVG